MSGKARVLMSDDALYQLYLEHNRDASSLSVKLGCCPSSCRKRIRNLLARRHHAITEQVDTETVNRVAELLKKANVDPNTIARIKNLRLKAYGVGIKNASGQFEQHGLHSTAFDIEPILSESDNPALTQAPPISVSYIDVPRVMRRLRVVVVVSDAQIGFLKGPKGLESIHDPDAVDVTMQVIAAEQPTSLYSIGDWLDMTQMSRWPQQPEFEGCLQASIDAGSRILGEMIAAAGPQCTERRVISGNHDIRAERYALANAKAFLGLRRANALPSEWPIASMPFLLRFDSLGVDYGALYPGDVHWILDDLMLTHELPKKLEFSASIIHGHDHKLTQTTYAQHGRHDRKNYFVYSIGCICRVGTRSDPTSLLRTQTPSDRGRTSWAQGVCVVEILDGSTPIFQVTQTRIENGRAIHRGQVLESRYKLPEAA